MADRKIDISFDWKRDGKKLFLLLILLGILVFVWIRVFYHPGSNVSQKSPNIFNKNRPSTNIPIPQATEGLKEIDIDELLGKSLFSYRNPLTLTAKRNPFSPPFGVASAKENKEEKVIIEPEITLPEDIELTGVVKAGNEVYAIIQGLDISDVVIEGDEILDGFIVEKIDIKNKRVILKKNGKRFILELKLRGE